MVTAHTIERSSAQPAPVPALRTHTSLLTRCLLLIAVFIVGIALAVTTKAIYTTSTGQVQTIMALKTVESLAARLNGIAWQSASHNELAPGVRENVDAVRTALASVLNELPRTEQDEQARLIVELGTQFLQQIEQELQLHPYGQAGNANVLVQERRELAYQALSESLNAAVGLYEQQAVRAGMHAHVEAATVLLLGIVMTAWLLWHFLKAQRRAELLTADQQALRASEERFRALVENASDIILTCTVDGTIREASAAALRVWGRPPATLHGRPLAEQAHNEDRGRLQHLLTQARLSPGTIVSSELRFHHVDGSARHCDVIANNLLTDQGIQGIVVTCRDISERKVFEEQLARLAFHDPLSNLPNRSLFISRLRHALVRKERGPHSQVGVLFLDLDNFKIVNDSLGHQVGDQLLIAVAERLQSCVRPVDTVARLGGDEFTVLLEDIANVSQAIEVAERILSALGTRFIISGHEIFTGTSIGITVSRPDQYRPDDLLRDADLAMYQAKTAGKAHYAVFDQSLTDRALERMELETDLRRAVERGELTIYYQPVVSLETNRVCEVEALIRWLHPTRGLIAPSQFIPLAEETGLILPIGNWVLMEACRQAVIWQSTQHELRGMTMSVNLSPRQFQEADLVDVVAQVLNETKLDPHHLKLEITESMMVRDSEATTTKLRKLKQLGVQLAIDDFGTGYCSLNYLKHLPVDTLKIDRSFISGLGHNAEDTAIVRAVVAFAKALTLTVTGEGVETYEQLAQLHALDCERGQGYFFGQPLPSSDVNVFFQKVPPWAQDKELTPPVEQGKHVTAGEGA